jgi:hypothetical protein
MQVNSSSIIASSALGVISCEKISVPPGLHGRIKQLLVRLNGGWQFITTLVAFRTQSGAFIRSGVQNAAAKGIDQLSPTFECLQISLTAKPASTY